MDYPDFYSKGPTPCSKVNPDDFLVDPTQPNAIKTTNAAKKVCVGCPYIEECLAWALYNSEPGVWGGTSKTERRKIKRATKLSRPAVRG